MNRAAVLGSPIAHSLSPALHRAAYASLGLDWTYEAVECTAEALPAFLDVLDPSWRGLSITMPLKQVVLAHLDARDDLVDVVQAANTVVMAEGGRRVGWNTDVPGMVDALGEADVAAGDVGFATVMGGGATARSALAALAALHCQQVTVFVRRPDAADELRAVGARLGMPVTIESWAIAEQGLLADVVVSTVPSGVADRLVGMVPEAPGVLLDVVYDPWPTSLALAWQQLSGTVASGLELLVHQAARQVELMTGRPAPLAVMRAAGAAELASR
ncbi:MAG: shikimate dehydrogenase [Candidatus Nanopelagicales bacterium]